MKPKIGQEVFNTVQSITGHVLTDTEMEMIETALLEDDYGEYMTEHQVDESYNIVENHDSFIDAAKFYKGVVDHYDNLRIVKRII